MYIDLKVVVLLFHHPRYALSSRFVSPLYLSISLCLPAIDQLAMPLCCLVVHSEGTVDLSEAC